MSAVAELTNLPISATDAADTSTAAPTPDPTAAAAALEEAEKAVERARQAVELSGANVPSGQPIGGDAVAGADAIKDAVSEQSVTIAGLVEKLDSWGFTVADTRVSVWSLLVVVMVVAAVIIGARVLSKLAHAILDRTTKLDPSQKLLGEKILTILVWSMAILIGIDTLGINLTALTVFSGAFGLAIGFGLQKTFGNLIAGIILLLDRSIKPGDVIAIADQAGNESFGQIRKIGIRAVSIVTRDEKEYLIPNENLMVNQVENWSYSSKNVRMQVEVGVSYDADMKLAEKLMLQAAADCPRVLKVPPPTAWMREYGDSSVNFTIHCWIVDPEEGVGNIRSQVLKRLWDLFQENNIEIPFPQRDLNLRDNGQFQQLVAAIAQRVDKKTEKE